MSEFILEILSEEIPARMQGKALEDLERIVLEKCAQAGLMFSGHEAFVTPRRLSLGIFGLPLRQEKQVTQKKGPRVDAPMSAQEGFFQTVGGVEKCRKLQTDKGDYWMADIVQEGRGADEVLREIIIQTLSEMTFPKSMRWGDKKMLWVRPITQILCLFNGKKIDIDGLEIKVVNFTKGHRFMGKDEIPVSSWKGYQEDLEKNYVILDSAQRRQMILDQIENYLKNTKYFLIEDERLMQEVTGLVEFPQVFQGKIDLKFMFLPKELMIAVCKKHQRYFLCQDKEGNLAPFFLFAANIKPKDGGKILIAGNERVLRARLSDGLFFFENDKKNPLESYLKSLNTRVFHQKLGTMDQKILRMSKFALKINALTYKLEEKIVQTAASLAKADLATGLVNEFPELQGIAGKYYAAGYADQIANAIEDHYKPQGPGEPCPKAPLSVIIALADKIDTLREFFNIGQKPTGSKDPFALRRGALGVIRLILENELKFNLKNLLDQESLYSFILDRFKVMLKEEGFSHNVVGACLGDTSCDLMEIKDKIIFLRGILEGNQGKILLNVFSRTANILKETDIKGAPSPELFLMPQEKDLYENFEKIKKENNYQNGLQSLLFLSTPLESFFQDVIVHDNDSILRENRLRLLREIRDYALRFADFYAF